MPMGNKEKENIHLHFNLILQPLISQISDNEKRPHSPFCEVCPCACEYIWTYIHEHINFYILLSVRVRESTYALWKKKLFPQKPCTPCFHAKDLHEANQIMLG